MVGYNYYENMGFVDSYLHAALILSGMGPIGEMHTLGGKLFLASYSLFSGIIFLIVMAIFIAPLFHRFLHNFLIKDVE